MLKDTGVFKKMESKHVWKRQYPERQYERSTPAEAKWNPLSLEHILPLIVLTGFLMGCAALSLVGEALVNMLA